MLSARCPHKYRYNNDPVHFAAYKILTLKNLLSIVAVFSFADSYLYIVSYNGSIFQIATIFQESLAVYLTSLKSASQPVCKRL